MPVSRTALNISLLMFLGLPAFSQQYLAGRVRRRASQEVLPSVSVVNRTQRKTNISDIGGNYKVPAQQGDTVIFSSAGYQSDTTIITNRILKEKDGYQVFLQPNAQILPTVRVGEQSNYQLDSLKRKEEYAWLYPVHRRKLIGSETPSEGFGIIISPIDYFSSRETQRRRLRRRTQQEEKEYYIDSRFPPAYIARITGLKDDSLRIFMVRYRPAYLLCRTMTSNEDIFLYINAKVKEFRNGSR
jgi:hypothetical protein